MNKLDFKFNFQDFSVSLPDEASQSVWAEIFKEREYKAAEQTISQATDPIVDVGAHVGLFVLYVRSLNLSSLVYSLEPEEKNFDLLQKNIKDNKLSKIKPLQIALGGRSESGNLIVTIDSHNHHLENAPAVRISENEQNLQTNQSVQILSLRDFFVQEKIKIVSLLKMDIEGGEYDVFSACMPADFARIKTVIMEYHNYSGFNYKEIENQFRENGFGVQIFPSKFDKNMGFVFAKNKRI